MKKYLILFLTGFWGMSLFLFSDFANGQSVRAKPSHISKGMVIPTRGVIPKGWQQIAGDIYTAAMPPGFISVHESKGEFPTRIQTVRYNNVSYQFGVTRSVPASHKYANKYVPDFVNLTRKQHEDDGWDLFEIKMLASNLLYKKSRLMIIAEDGLPYRNFQYRYEYLINGCIVAFTIASTVDSDPEGTKKALRVFANTFEVDQEAAKRIQGF